MCFCVQWITHAHSGRPLPAAPARADNFSLCCHAADGSNGSPAEPWTVAGLEAAYSALSSSSNNPTAALAETESLAAARQRALKAAALPPPQFRSHAGGVSLSPGAADVAARCAGAFCTRVRRFVLAAGEAARLAEGGGCAVQHCPDVLGVGHRPLPYTPHAFGNRCEPLWNRGALEAVRQLIMPGWRVLEWHTGGSTAWFLARNAKLTSIEGAPGDPAGLHAGSGVSTRRCRAGRGSRLCRQRSQPAYCVVLPCGRGCVLPWYRAPPRALQHFALHPSATPTPPPAVAHRFLGPNLPLSSPLPGMRVRETTVGHC